jgi:protein ImuB
MPSLYACLRSPRTPDVALDVAKEFSPRLQRYGSGCVVLDVGGLGRLLGEPPAIGAELVSRIAELSHGTRIADFPHGTRISRITESSHEARIFADRRQNDPQRSVISEKDPRRSVGVAVAPTQIGALVLSAASSGLSVETGDIASALAPVRLEVLRDVLGEVHRAALSGHEDPWRSAKSASRERSEKSASRERYQRSASRDKDQRSTFEILDRWGLTTLGDVAALPAEALSARLGQAGIALQRMARGVDSGPLVPDPDVPRFLERVELEWPIDGLEPLSFVLARLLEPLSAALERADRAAAAIHLNLRLVDRTGHTRMLQLPAAMRDPKVLRTLLVLDLESHPPRAAIDIVSIEVDPAPGRVVQYSLLERARPSPETLATLTARLGALVGESRAGQPVLLDSHGPDAFEMRRFAPDAPLKDAAPVTDAVASTFRRKNPFASAVLRRFRPPIAIRVTVERGRPRHVFIDRRGMPGGYVEQCAGPWRSSGAWWTERSWNRDEWDVALSDGSVCRVFQARHTEHWFLDGVID